MSKGQPTKIVGAIGLLFFAVAVINFVRGESWLVWVILGLLFNGAAGVKSLMDRRRDA